MPRSDGQISYQVRVTGKLSACDSCCHVEPFDFTQDRLPETSLAIPEQPLQKQSEILRSAQNDILVACRTMLWI
jgi:hypothetical protein